MWLASIRQCCRLNENDVLINDLLESGKGILPNLTIFEVPTFNSEIFPAVAKYIIGQISSIIATFLMPIIYLIKAKLVDI